MVVGADRVVANGDTANKVGTYQLAIAAKHHGIPFYVAAPSTSCDLSLESGRDIIIEVRPPEELTSINGLPIAAPGKKSCSRLPRAKDFQALRFVFLQRREYCCMRSAVKPLVHPASPKMLSL